MIFQIRPLALERKRTLGRRIVYHDAPVPDSFWRGRSGTIGMNPQDAVSRGRYRRTSGYPSVVMIAPVFVVIDEHITPHSARVHENLVVDDRHAARLVHVVNVRDVNVVDVVIAICDVRDVRNTRVADVDGLKIISAHVVVGNVRLTIAERKPSDSSAAAANPRDESRRIARTHIYRSRHPTPRS
jgi:hypothetical protein